MTRLYGWLLALYALSVCFGDAFGPHPWVPIPLAVLLGSSILVGGSLFLKPRVRFTGGCFRLADLLLVAFVFTLGLSLLLSGEVEPTNIHHFLAYGVVVGVYYFFVKFLFAADDTYVTYASRIRTALALSVGLVSAYALLEFVDRNFVPLGVTRFVTFPGDDVLGPISLVYVRDRWGRLAAAAFLVLTGGAFCVTLSAGGLVFLAVGLAAAVFMYVADRAFLFVPVRALLIVVSVLALMATALVTSPAEWLIPVTSKLALTDLSSGQERVQAWREALSVAAEHPLLGTGVGSTSVERGSGVISFYLTMLKEAGTVSLALILVFFALIFRRIMMLPSWNRFKYAYAVSFVAALCHYAIISDIWYPWLWLLCVFVTTEPHHAPVAELTGSRRSPAPVQST
ncbi:MAG: hypothetical protein AUH42_05540 [Gemmatimonadetes bacterium 13_1_40CM_70_11]|nr:MAG: hypothetical protein AUH42_05540 [Gemmatimonadetes bacterium 13_1_40CM_70_11]